MRPLVYYARWRGAKLRLAGRDDRCVWGRFVDSGDTGLNGETFRFDTDTWELQLGQGDDLRTVQLDEMGVVVAPGDPPPTTNAAVEL